MSAFPIRAIPLYQTPTFEATWNTANQHLKVIPPKMIQKIIQVAWNIISVLIPVILVVRLIGWCVANISKYATLPSAQHYSPEQLQEIRDLFNGYCFGPVNEENRRFRAAYEVDRHNVTTPDGARLAALHFRHQNSGPETPTILYFQPNLALSEHFIFSWLLEEALRRGTPCNFIAFDYRSVSLSHGDLKRPEDLILDGEAMYQFATTRLNIPPDKLKMNGWSLGGCISANTKALHPECTATYVNERSFSSTRDIVRAWMGKIQRIFLFWFPFAMEVTKWNLKTPIDRVQGPIMIVYHPEDSTIPYPASAHQLAVRTRTIFESVRLKSNNLLRLAQQMRFQIYHHAHPLKDYVVAERGNRPADQVIADFILGPAQQPIVAAAAG